MPYLNVIAEISKNTVVTEYEPVKSCADSYQSEAVFEKEFIENLHNKLVKLNNYQFYNIEWEYFFSNDVANPNEHIVEKTRKIQEDFVQVLKRDEGTYKNITLIDKKNIHNNFRKVINQYVLGTAEGAKYDNRYEVTVFFNGLVKLNEEIERIIAREDELRETIRNIIEEIEVSE